jgi:hypothetical protein
MAIISFIYLLTYSGYLESLLCTGHYASFWNFTAQYGANQLHVTIGLLNNGTLTKRMNIQLHLILIKLKLK